MASSVQSWLPVLEHGMSPNLHEDAFGIRGEPGIDYFELLPPISGTGISVPTIGILIPRDPRLFRSVIIIDTNLFGADRVCGLSQGLAQRSLLLFSQEELEAATFGTIQKGSVHDPILQF